MKRMNRWWLAAGLCIALVQSALAGELAGLAAGLAKGSFSDKEQAIKALQDSPSEHAGQVLRALVNGQLYLRNSDGALFIATAKEGEFIAVEGDDKSLLIPPAELKKISLNNRARGIARLAAASRSLREADPELRYQAALDMQKNRDASLAPLLVAALDKEPEQRVREVLRINLALIDLHDAEAGKRLKAIEAFSDTLEPTLLAVLDEVAANDTDASVKEAARHMLAKRRGAAELYQGVENLFFGISLGSVLLLAAIGLAITFGVMGVINMAHGEMIMLGAYTTFVIQQMFPGLIEYSVLMAIPLAFLVTCAVGMLIEWSIIRRLYGRPLETLLATFGVSLVLQQLVRTVFSPLNQSVITPDWMSGSWVINGALSITYNRLFIVVFSLLVLLGLAWLLRQTRLGLQMRAVTQNRAMAGSMGIRTGWVDALTFGIGSGIAGIAGVALSQLTNVGPNLGQAYIIDSFMVVVFGGVGNLFGTFFAAMSLGVVNKFLEPYSGAVLGKIIVLIFIILFIQWRPRGLFALKGRAIEG